MAMTVNGYIATRNDDTPWSEDEWKSYNNMVKKVGNIIMGNRTYKMIKSEDFKEMGDPVTVVLSSNTNNANNSKHFFVNTTKLALDKLNEIGFKDMLVGGGGKTNAAFMKEGLIDEVILDIEPQVFGKGILLFSENDFEYQLELLESKKLNKNTLQLHYKVLK